MFYETMEPEYNNHLSQDEESKFMGVFKRIYCPKCRRVHDIRKKNERLKQISCKKCDNIFKTNNANAKYYIEFYYMSRKMCRKVGPSKTQAKTAYQKIETDLAENKFLDIKREQKIKFEEFADEYLENHSKVNNKSWVSHDLRNINALKKHFSGRYLHEITVKSVEEFKSRRMKDVTPATVNRHLACLKSIFNKAIAWHNYSNVNPVTKVKLFKENNQRTRYLEQEEIDRLLSNCHEYFKELIIIALNTGMRKGELMNMKWRDVNLNQKIIYLYETKNNERREIPINRHVEDALIRVRKSPTSQHVFNKEIAITYRNIDKMFFTALKKSGINNFRFHDLRHTFASHLVMKGVDLNTVRELLGHKSIKMTLRYAHLSPSHKMRAVEVLHDTIVTINSPKENSDIETEIEIPVSI